jgi:hypothetical protein
VYTTSTVSRSLSIVTTSTSVDNRTDCNNQRRCWCQHVNQIPLCWRTDNRTQIRLLQEGYVSMLDNHVECTCVHIHTNMHSKIPKGIIEYCFHCRWRFGWRHSGIYFSCNTKEEFILCNVIHNMASFLFRASLLLSAIYFNSVTILENTKFLQNCWILTSTSCAAST